MLRVPAMRRKCVSLVLAEGVRFGAVGELYETLPPPPIVAIDRDCRVGGREGGVVIVFT